MGETLGRFFYVKKKSVKILPDPLRFEKTAVYLSCQTIQTTTITH